MSNEIHFQLQTALQVSQRKSPLLQLTQLQQPKINKTYLSRKANLHEIIQNKLPNSLIIKQKNIVEKKLNQKRCGLSKINKMGCKRSCQKVIELETLKCYQTVKAKKYLSLIYIVFLEFITKNMFNYQNYLTIKRLIQNSLKMENSSWVLSPWRKNNYSQDPIISLSNRKNNHDNSTHKKSMLLDRYITEPLQKCLFKDKLDFKSQQTLQQLKQIQSSSKKAKQKFAYQQILQNSLKKHMNNKLISYSLYKSKIKREGYLQQIYPQQVLKQQETTIRSFPKSPYKILDAPKLKDDFYTNLLDWSKEDIISVVLDNAAYIWSAKSNQAQKLVQGFISSVKWGKGLVIGQQTGRIRVIDVQKKKETLRQKNHLGRVGCLDISSNHNLIASGSKDSQVLIWDIRQNQVANRFEGHKQQICGLKWSVENNYLASGGNDNLIFVWEPRMGKHIGKLTDHTAAVKALAWSPHRNSLLATGGGSTDKTIKQWDIAQMRCIQSTQTGSQVCNMAFSSNTDQLVSTHGYSLNSIVVWKVKNMQKLATLQGHSYRVLYLAKSPDQQSILTGSGDQTLRFWKIFSSQKSTYDNNSSRLQLKNFMIR